MWQFLPKSKDNEILGKQWVYEILCGDCRRAYIGQANRGVKSRKVEYKLYIEKRVITLSLPQHFNQID